jgi:hypothetical protein
MLDNGDVHVANNMWTCSFRKAKLAPDEDGVSVEETLLDHGTFFYLSDRFLKGGSELVVKDLIESFKKCETVEEAIAATEEEERQNSTLEDGSAEVVEDGIEEAADGAASTAAAEPADELTYEEKCEQFAIYLYAKPLRAYGELAGVADEDVTYALIDQAIEHLKNRNLSHVYFGGRDELYAFLCRGAAGAEVFWQFSHSNRTGGALNGRGEPLWTTCTDHTSLAIALAEPPADDGKIYLSQFKEGAAMVRAVMPSKRVRNVRALVDSAFRNWNKMVPAGVLGRKDRFRFGTSGFSAASMFYNAIAAHRLSVKAGKGPFIKTPAVLRVAHVDAFAHFGDEGHEDYNDEDKTVGRLPDLSFKSLVAGLHVDAIDVAVMQDIQTIVFSAIIAAAMNRPGRTA